MQKGSGTSVDFRTYKSDHVLVVNIIIRRATSRVSDMVKQKLTGEIEKGNKFIVVDLNNVDFTDSSFLGALLAAHKSAVRKNGSIRICGLVPQVKNVFDVTHLNKIFMVYDDVDKAVKSFSDFGNQEIK
jgi:anti-sigma B factor antagonist